MTILSCLGVLFDCDGVLVDSEASVISAWARWALQLNLNPDDVQNLVQGRRSTDTVALLVAEGQRPAELRRIDRYEIEDAATVTAIAGAKALLESVPADRWAVVTSGRADLARARLRAANLPVPTVLVTAEDVERGKPDPEGYRTAAKRLRIPPQNTVVIEDVPIGIEAARAAGAGAIVGVGRRALSAGADVVVPDLRPLRWTAEGLEIDPSRVEVDW